MGSAVRGRDGGDQLAGSDDIAGGEQLVLHRRTRLGDVRSGVESVASRLQRHAVRLGVATRCNIARCQSTWGAAGLSLASLDRVEERYPLPCLATWARICLSERAAPSAHSMCVRNEGGGGLAESRGMCASEPPVRRRQRGHVCQVGYGRSSAQPARLSDKRLP